PADEAAGAPPRRYACKHLGVLHSEVETASTPVAARGEVPPNCGHRCRPAATRSSTATPSRAACLASTSTKTASGCSSPAAPTPRAPSYGLRSKLAAFVWRSAKIGHLFRVWWAQGHRA